MAEAARRRFASYRHVQVLQGDSGTVLHHVLPNVRVPALFWLDAHYTGGASAGAGQRVPIVEEIDAIAARGGDFEIAADIIRWYP